MAWRFGWCARYGDGRIGSTVGQYGFSWRRTGGGEMHEKNSFTERFRSKNAPPLSRGNNGAKQPKPATPTASARPRAKRWMGAPLEFVAEVCRLTEGRATLVVALYIYRRVHVCGSRTVTLPSGELTELGVVRQYKQMALSKLQRAGLIKVETGRGQTARVTLIWQRC
jgi:hypothetical protein